MMSFLVGSEVNVVTVIGGKVAFFVIIALLAWKGVPYVMSKLGRIKITQPAMSIALALCFLFAYIAEFLELRASLVRLPLELLFHKRNLKKK